MADGLNMSRRIRRTPYTDRVEALGVRGFSVVNHMLLPKAFETSVEEDYWHLRTYVQLWDVSCQRQVEISGPDAGDLVQLMTPRNISKAKVGQCLYVPIIDDQAGLINDPVLLKLAEDRFWLSIADSDLLLYAKGLALGRRLNVNIHEPDVFPLSVQGPQAEALLAEVFGPHVRDIGFFRFGWIEVEGTRQLIARSGYSRQGGFEIYVQGAAQGPGLWDLLWKAGQAYNIRPGCPNLIERIEGGLFSYGNEMTLQNNPFEIGLGKFCDVSGSIDYIGRDAVCAIAAQGPQRLIHAVEFEGPPVPTCAIPWPVICEGQKIGEITSGIYSPRLENNIGLSLIEKGYWRAGLNVDVRVEDQPPRAGWIRDLPVS
ncbi:MAG: dimethylsulfoniopropionate demethylase [Paracoccaceae bacterium]